MNAQDLKNSILQLAIQGKMVEQREEEGSAKDLLNQIRAEKERLIKEKKIKKEKPLPEITEDEIPFDIPESWEWVRLGEVGSWSAGATPSRANPEYYSGNIPWLKTGDLNDSYIDSVSEFISDKALEKASVRINPIGSVLMAMYGATIGKLGILNIEATTNQACCACITYKGVINKYLFYFLMGQRKNFIKMGAGGAQPNISKEKIVMSIIPLPPIEEQKRIVAKIEELMPFIDKYGESYLKLETLNKKFPEDMQKSILQYAIQGKLVEQRAEEGTAEDLYQQIQAEKARLVQEGKIKKDKPLPEIIEDEIPFEIPESWKWVRLGDVSKNIHYGYTASASEVGNCKLLRITDIQNNHVDWKSVPYCEIKETDYLTYGLNNRDVMIARTGGTIGKTYIVDSLDDRVVFASYLIRVIPVDCINEIFLKKYMESPLYWNQLNAGSMGTGQPNVNGSTLSKLLLPLPPLEEQKRIVDRIEELLPHCLHLVK